MKSSLKSFPIGKKKCLKFSEKKKKSLPDSFDLQSYLFTAHSQALVTKTEFPPHCLFHSRPASDILKWSAATEGRVSLEAQIKGEKENILKPLQEGSASSVVPSVQLQQCCFPPDFECIYQTPSIAQGLRGDKGTWRHSLSLSFGVSLCRTCVHFPLAPFPVAAGSAIFGNKALEGPLAFVGCRVKRTPCTEMAVYNTNQGEEAGTISTKEKGKK